MSRSAFPTWIVVPALLAACQDPGAAERRLDHELLLRERAALERALSRDPGRGDADVLVAVPASLVRELLAFDLPFDAEIDRFRVTVESAGVDFRGSAVALVTLGGRVAWAEREGVEADVEIVGSLRVLGIDTSSGSLRAGVEILGVRTRDVRLGGVAPPAERLVDALAGRPLEELQALVREVQIPIRLLRHIELPRVDEDEVTIEAARLPLSVAVRGIRVGDDLLVVELDVDVPLPGPSAAPEGAGDGGGEAGGEAI